MRHMPVHCMPVHLVNTISHHLNEMRAESVEPIWSISVAINHINSTIEAVLIHRDGYSQLITATNVNELGFKVKDYLDPWRQYKETE